MWHSDRVAGVRRWNPGALGLLLVAFGIVVGCGGSGSSSSLSGAWTANLSPPGMNVDPVKIEIKDDGTYAMTRSTCTESGKWKSFGSAGSLSLTTTATASSCGGTLNTDTTVRYYFSSDGNTLLVMRSNFGVAAVSMVLQRGTGVLPARPPTPAGLTATITNHANGEITVNWTAAAGAAAYNVIYSGAYGSGTQGVITGTSAVITIGVAGASNWEGNTSFSVTAIGAGGSSEASAIVKG